MAGGILALDIATRCGWCSGSPGRQPRSGVRNFGGGGKQDGEVFASFAQWLNDLLTVEAPAALVFEAPIMGGNRATPAAARRLMGLAAIAEMTAHQRGIRCMEEHLATVKKAFAGSGRADKDAVMRKVRDLGFKPADDNEADAIALWHVAARTLAPRVMAAWESERFSLASV